MARGRQPAIPEPKGICSWEGCDREVRARGFCGRCYQRFVKTEEFTPFVWPTSCEYSDCPRPHHSHGLCAVHWSRHQRGSPMDAPIVSPGTDHRDRLLAKVDRSGPIMTVRPDLGPCWIWMGKPSTFGYGRMGGHQGDAVAVHRVSYEVFVGPIPEGYEVDHLCRNKMCCNPDHLEAVTKAENNRRALAYRWHGIVT